MPLCSLDTHWYTTCSKYNFEALISSFEFFFFVVLVGMGANLMAKSVDVPSTSSNKWTVAQAPLPSSFPTLHFGLLPLRISIPTGEGMLLSAPRVVRNKSRRRDCRRVVFQVRCCVVFRVLSLFSGSSMFNGRKRPLRINLVCTVFPVEPTSKVNGVRLQVEVKFLLELNESTVLCVSPFRLTRDWIIVFWIAKYPY